MEVTSLQSLTSGKWGGSCALFSLWYMCLRLLNPSRSSSNTYLLMVDFLKSNKNPNVILRNIVRTFVSLVDVNIDEFTVNGRSFRNKTIERTISRRKKKLQKKEKKKQK